jgi:hypothetical protein
MAIRLQEILWLVAAALWLVSAFRRRVDNGLRVPLIEPAAIAILAVCLGYEGRQAAVDGRPGGSLAAWLAAFGIGVAAVILAVRMTRARGSRSS